VACLEQVQRGHQAHRAGAEHGERLLAFHGYRSSTMWA
jgi:hypothetical protein